MIKSLLVAHRDRERLREIMGVASRYGLGIFVARMGLARDSGADAADMADTAADSDPNSLPRRTRLALEELGPTFVKLGQILATRGDLLPPEWTSELEQLHSKAPTLPFDELRAAVEEALGEPPETAFAAFDPVPLAAASMAQVHRATLLDGQEVVLKIRRPAIRPKIEADLRLIAQLAAVAESASAEARRFEPAALMEQLAEALLEELDFTGEGRNADRLRADFARNPKVIVPRIHWAWSSETLLVMDYVDGIPPRDGNTLRAAGIDPEAIASLGSDIVLDMVLVNGRFHGDPHPGNLLCLPGNRIALLDCGMMGHVSPRRREELIDFVLALANGNPAPLADVLAIWSAGSDTPRDKIVATAERLTARHSGGKLVLSKMVADFLTIMRSERMTMPPDLLLIFKALMTLDGVMLAIAPDFDLTEAMQRSSRRILQARLSPDHWQPNVQALLRELGRISDDAPRLLRSAVQKLESDKIPPPPPPDYSPAILAGARWIAGSVVIAGALIAAAEVWV